MLPPSASQTQPPYRHGTEDSALPNRCRLLKLCGVFVKRVIGVIFAAWEVECASQNHRDVLVFQQTADFPGVAAAENDWLQLHLFGEFDRASNLWFTIGS